jgi:hypothetical protein
MSGVCRRTRRGAVDDMFLLASPLLSAAIAAMDLNKQLYDDSISSLSFVAATAHL